MDEKRAPLEFCCAGFRYRRGPEALHGMTLSVGPGEFVTVVGPNGAGKSTLLKLAAGMLKPENGDVLLFGDAAHELSRREAARRAAFAAEIEPVDYGLTVEEALLQAAYPQQAPWELFPEEAEERLAEALARLRLSNLAARPVGGLSDGERKRTALARAMMQNTPLVLLDEPAGHLDFASQAELVETLKRFKDEGKTVVAVEHNFLLSGRLADRVVVLCAGTVKASGPPSEVLTPEILREAYGAELDVVEHDGVHHVLLK